MTITPVFTTGDDRYAVSVADTYELNFLAGDDWLTVRAGTLTAWMGSGNDYAWLGGGGGIVNGQIGNDRFDIRSSGWEVNGGADDDLFRIFAGDGHELIGAAGNDRFDFYADSSGVHASAGDGDDLFVGRGHAIGGALYGGAGNDRFVGFSSPADEILVLRGGAGNDVYRLDNNLDVRVDERTGEGIDTVIIAGGLDYALGANVENLIALTSVGTNASAILNGNELNNRIQGSIGFDSISGGAGNDTIEGGAGNDTIEGGTGNDRIIGGLGVDYMGGGEGDDRYIFRSTAETSYDPSWTDADWIYQFDSGDRIDLSAIDADTTQAGFQHFQVAGNSAGTAKGFLYYSADPGGWGFYIVEGYTNDDDIPDFYLLISNSSEGYPPITIDSFIV